MLNLLVIIDKSGRSKQSIDWIQERHIPADIYVILLFVWEKWDDIRSKEQYAMAIEEVLPLLRESVSTLSGFLIATEVCFGRAGKRFFALPRSRRSIPSS